MPLFPRVSQEEQADVLQHQPDGWMCQGLGFLVPVSGPEICLLGADYVLSSVVGNRTLGLLKFKILWQQGQQNPS